MNIINWFIDLFIADPIRNMIETPWYKEKLSEREKARQRIMDCDTDMSDDSDDDFGSNDGGDE